MQKKWYFQETLAPANLLSISAAACNFGYSLYGPNTQSPCITLYCLNTAFYQLHDWSNTKQDKYLPYSTYPKAGYTFKGPKGEVTIANDTSYTYAKSVSLTEGFFSSKSFKCYTSTIRYNKNTQQSNNNLQIQPISRHRHRQCCMASRHILLLRVDTAKPF